MPAIAEFALALGIVFAINLMPAFGPPTWAVLVVLTLNSELPAVPLIVGGALAAAAGRFVLANGARRLRPRLSQARRASLDRSQRWMSENRPRTAAGFALFLVSPMPSGQMFVAAGLMTVPLLPLTAVFFCGRLVTYSIYVSAASVAERNLGDVALNALTSPIGIGLQIVMIVAVAAIAGGIRPEPAGRAKSG